MKDFKSSKAGYFYSGQCNIAEFKEIINQNLAKNSVPNALEVHRHIPIYDISELQSSFSDNELKRELMACETRLSL